MRELWSYSFSGKCVGITKDLIFIYKFGFIFVYSEKKLVRLKFFSLSLLISDLPFFHQICRILRKGVVSGISNDNFIFVWSRKKYYFFAIPDLKLLKKGEFLHESAPLQPIFKSCDLSYVICGEYKSNYRRQDCSIYGLSHDREKEVIFKFSGKKIEHIHSFVRINSQRFFVLCGDFDVAASIWVLDLVDKNCHRLLFDDQLYRAGCGYLFENGLVYATDSSSISNYLIHFNEGIVQKIHPLPSSVIYGDGFANFFGFSTNLECSLESRDNFYTKWFKNILPQKFETRFVCLFLLDNDLNLIKLAELPPTSLPWRLFQYPTARVHISSDRVIFTLQSIHGMPNKCLVFKFPDL